MKTWRVLFIALAVSLFGAIGCGDDNDNGPAPSNDAGTTQEAGPGADAGVPVKAQVIILHNNDLHSHLMGYGPEADYSPATLNDDSTISGFARLAGAIKAERTAAGNIPVLLLNSGDFTMGSMFEFLGTAIAAELTEMQKMGYDAISLGNHEFDWTNTALVGYLNAAFTGGFQVPILASNIKFSTASTDDDALEALMTQTKLQRKYIKTLANGLKVGFIGLMGTNAAGLVATSAPPITFEKYTDTAKQLVKELRETDKVDLVIALSHSGINAQAKGEDATMATQVPGIDVIISGHTHDATPLPIKVNNTWIVQAGYNGENLGKMVLNLHTNGTTSIDSYKLIAIDDKIQGDAETQTRIDGYIATLDSAMAAYSMSYKKEVAETSFDITAPPNFQENTLGHLVTDAYLGVVSALQPSALPDIAIESSGLIRDYILKGKSGKLSVADVFRVLPLGIGYDKLPGYPLITAYINGAEIKTLLEIIPLSKDLGNNDYFINISGLKMEYTASKPMFQRITKATLNNSTEINLTDTSKCYKVVLSLYLYYSLGLLKDMGAPAIVPKEQDCSTALANVATRFVDVDPAAAGTQELKSYQALIKYLGTFSDTNSNQLPEIPATYSKIDSTNQRMIQK